MIFKFKRLSHLSYRVFRLGFCIKILCISFMLIFRSSTLKGNLCEVCSNDGG